MSFLRNRVLKLCSELKVYNRLGNVACKGCKREKHGFLEYSTCADLESYLKQTIKISGPITVARYMKEVLTNPKWGYYMNRDVFGKSGDFITSPEISQIFGELIGVWFLNHWLENGRPKEVILIELGPGRGTLMADILRVFNQFPIVKGVFSVHLVEVSPEMLFLQRKTLGVLEDNNKNCCLKCKKERTSGGVTVEWHRRLQDVPRGYTFLLAHEFFDALPIHQFQKTEDGWREVLIDNDTSNSGLRFVLAPGPSIIADTFINKSHTAQQCEICPDAAAITEYAADLIENNGGAALIVDYGNEGSHYFSLRGFMNHQLKHNVLENFGKMDITANVDFELLRKSASDKVHSFGPITQRKFLKAMGIDARMAVLLGNAEWCRANSIFSAYDYLMSDEKMGEKFKVFSLVNKNEKHPAGFQE